MTDLALAGMWLTVLGGGLGACIAVHALGLRPTYVRDALHIGASVWIVGWPFWHGGAVPVAIVAFVAFATAVLPLAAHHNRLAARLVRAVTSSEEHWLGLIHYTLAYATLTAIGLAVDPFPAAAALLALSLGDGLGGLAGRELGTHTYRAPGGKQKSLEGSFVVGIAASAAVLFAASLFGRDLAYASAFGLGAIAAIAEALSPRGTDNLIVPATVWIAATLAT